MLKVDDLNVSYGATEVLRSVSFEVPPGAIVALMGGNGAGKSTTLNAMSGLVKPRAGTITVDGARIDGRPPEAIVRSGVSQVPQGRYCWARMSVDDNLRLGAVTRRDKAGVREDLDAMFELFPVLRGRRRSAAGALSGGQQQMVAVARALMARPRYLLMDEPSHGLAPKVVDDMIEAIRAINQRGLTILLVEQNVGMAAALASRVHILKNGEIALSGDAAGILTSSQMLDAYLGR
jgi:branched-chain amino acid transport system ATP-binding protein